MVNSLPAPSVLFADRAHKADNGRNTMATRTVVPVIRMRKTSRRRVAVDRALYRPRILVGR